MINLTTLIIIITFIGILLQKTSTNLSFFYNKHIIEIPMLIAISSIIIIVLWQIMLIKKLILLWFDNRKLINSIKYLKKAGFSLIAGKFLHCETIALRIHQQTPFTWLGLLLATTAAIKQHNLHNANNYLNEIELLTQKYPGSLSDPNEIIALGLIKADLYQQKQEDPKCIFELNKLHKKFSGNVVILSKLIEMYQATNNWHELIGLFPIIKKLKLYSPKDLNNLELTTYIKRLQQLQDPGSIECTIKFFKSIPKEFKKHHLLILNYVKCLNKLTAFELTAKILKNYLQDLDNALDLELIELYSQHSAINISEKIKYINNWITNHPNHPELLLIMAKLCNSAELFGKAKNYLEQALSLDLALGDLITLHRTVNLTKDL